MRFRLKRRESGRNPWLLMRVGSGGHSVCRTFTGVERKGGKNVCSPDRPREVISEWKDFNRDRRP